LVKTSQFRDHTYVGDPVNAVRVFSEFGADELMILDINGYREARTIPAGLLEDISCQATAPLSVGGGIRTLSDIGRIVSAGAEKIILGSHAVTNPQFVRQAAMEFGSSTISVCIDAKPAPGGGYEACTLNGSRRSGIDVVSFALMMEEMGAGELVVQSIERDGQLSGFDLDLVGQVATSVSVPVVALGGGRHMDDFKLAWSAGSASAAAAGSAFVFFRKRGAVLLNYPPKMAAMLNGG
jgi:cyclase